MVVDLTSVDTRSSEREAATYRRMHDITSAYRKSEIYQRMTWRIRQSCQHANKPMIPFKSKESPSCISKLGVLLRWEHYTFWSVALLWAEFSLFQQKNSLLFNWHFLTTGGQYGICPGTGWVSSCDFHKISSMACLWHSLSWILMMMSTRVQCKTGSVLSIKPWVHHRTQACWMLWPCVSCSFHLLCKSPNNQRAFESCGYMF